MANTYTLIASSTVGSGGAANIEFTSIPATYTDLVVYLSSRTTASDILGAVIMQFNDTTTSYSSREIDGTGSSAASYSRSTLDNGLYCGSNGGNTATSNTFGNMSIYIPNYTSANYKSVSIDAVQENNATEAHQTLLAGLWSNTSAITKIKLYGYSGVNFMQYSTAYLYGISNS
jgi:hypothetical protein